jgi:two-component system response regulator
MSGKTILLVEDNPDDVDLTLDAFKECRVTHRIDVVNDGAAAVEYLTRPLQGDDRPLPVFVLLDLKLPKMDGLSVLRRMRADPILKRVPVVMLTTSKEQEDVLASYDLGANSYIRKPVDFDEFVDAVRQIGLYWLALNEPVSATVPKPVGASK